jgi:hypothetical protein
MKYPEDMQSQSENPDVQFDAVMTRALERGPEVSVPMDFAARVAASLPPARKPRRTMQVSRTAAIASAGVLAVAMFVLAPHAAPTFASLAFDFELIAILQLAGIGYWLTVRRGI